jgi:hypothetical protein
MDIHQMREVLNRIEYPGYTFYIDLDFNLFATYNGSKETHYTTHYTQRYQLLPTDSEKIIIRVARNCIINSVMHHVFVHFERIEDDNNQK